MICGFASPLNDPDSRSKFIIADLIQEQIDSSGKTNQAKGATGLSQKTLEHAHSKDFQLESCLVLRARLVEGKT